MNKKKNSKWECVCGKKNKIKDDICKCCGKKGGDDGAGGYDYNSDFEYKKLKRPWLRHIIT